MPKGLNHKWSLSPRLQPFYKCIKILSQQNSSSTNDTGSVIRNPGSWTTTATYLILSKKNTVDLFKINTLEVIQWLRLCLRTSQGSVESVPGTPGRSQTGFCCPTQKSSQPFRHIKAQNIFRQKILLVAREQLVQRQWRQWRRQRRRRRRCQLWE